MSVLDRQEAAKSVSEVHKSSKTEIVVKTEAENINSQEVKKSEAAWASKNLEAKQCYDNYARNWLLVHK